jgi:hypothetical protein
MVNSNDMAQDKTAFVVFASHEDAKAALNLHGRMLQDRMVHVIPCTLQEFDDYKLSQIPFSVRCLLGPSIVCRVQH